MQKLKYFLIVLITIIHFKLYAQDFDKVYFNSKWIVTSIDNALYYRVSGFNPYLPAYDGDVADYYLKTNQIEMTGHYTNGAKNGEFTFYYPNGQLKLIARFDNNNRIGTWKEFYNNGYPKIEVAYDGEMELVLKLNDSLGNSIIDQNKFKYSLLYFDVPEPFDNSILKKDEIIEISGNVLDNLREGNWSITKDNEPYAYLVYEKGVLTNGYCIVDNQKIVLTNNSVFPLIVDPFKFFTTENFSFSPGAVIKNNYVTEGLHQYKYKSMEKVNLANYEELEAYINDNLDLRSTKDIGKIKIIFKINNGKIENFITEPKILKRTEEELRLLIESIESINITATDTVVMEYTIKVDTTIH